MAAFVVGAGLMLGLQPDPIVETASVAPLGTVAPAATASVVAPAVTNGAAPEDDDEVSDSVAVENSSDVEAAEALPAQVSAVAAVGAPEPAAPEADATRSSGDVSSRMFAAVYNESVDQSPTTQSYEITALAGVPVGTVVTSCSATGDVGCSLNGGSPTTSVNINSCQSATNDTGTVTFNVTLPGGATDTVVIAVTCIA